MKQGTHSAVQPPLRAVHMGLFPTMGSLQDVLDLADSKLPITTRNDAISLLMIMQNTVLASLKGQATQ